MINTQESKIPLPVHIQHFFIKYRILSTCDLAILISHKLKAPLSFDKLQKKISVILSSLKKEGKVSKIGGRNWKWEL